MPPNFMPKSKHSFAKMGIKAETSFDFPKMMGFKQEAIDGNTKGIDFLLKKNKVTVFRGTGKIAGAGQGRRSASEMIETKHIVIATGSDVAKLKGIDIDEKRIVSSTGALELKKVPAHLAVIGAGVIGLELGSVYARLGAKVTVIEYLDRILPGMDVGCRQELPAHAAEAGLHLQARLQGHGCREGQGQGDAHRRARRGRCRRIARGRRRARRRGPRSVHGRPRPRGRRRQARQSRPHRGRSTITPPASPASMPSATSSRARCSPTRRRTRASPWPKSSPARRAM